MFDWLEAVQKGAGGRFEAVLSEFGVGSKADMLDVSADSDLVSELQDKLRQAGAKPVEAKVRNIQ